MSPDAALAIEARGLTRRFGERVAVDGLDLDVRAGEIFGYLGSNGAGKSTTIRMLSGILAPTAGEAWICGRSVLHEPEAVKGEIGYMSQAFGLYRDLTVAENLTFFAGLRFEQRRTRRARVQESLARFGLARERRTLAANLSGGWKQRLALACAVVHEPRLVFLDEPTAGIDPVSRRELWDELYELSARGTTLFVTTHYMEEAERCHRLAFVHAGRRLACGTPHALKRDALPGVLLAVALTPGEGLGQRLQQALVALRAAQGELGLEDVNLYGEELHAVAPPGAAEPVARSVRALLAAAGHGAAQVAPIAPSIEDVFVALTRQADRAARAA